MIASDFNVVVSVSWPSFSVRPGYPRRDGGLAPARGSDGKPVLSANAATAASSLPLPLSPSFPPKT